MRRLIVNADDFGLTHGVNRAIIEAHGRGIVTSTTLMASSNAFDDAVKLASQAPRLSVGCHVMLVDGRPLLAGSSVPTLIRQHQRGDANFRGGFGALASSAVRGQLRAEEIEAEVTAQIRKIQAAGISVSHLDSHKHTHILFSVLQPMLRAARACGVRAIRNPFVPLRPLALAHLVRRPRLWKRYSGLRFLRRAAQKFRRLVETEGMSTTDGTFGMVVTGALDERLFEAILGSIPPGTWEFVCHPGYNDAELDGVRTRLRQSRVEELRLLTSAAAREILERNEVELISYRDLGK